MKTLQLGIPDSGNGFLSVPIPSITFDQWESYPDRFNITFKDVAVYSQYGTPLITGNRHKTKYGWSFNYKLFDDDFRIIQNLYEWQQNSQEPLRLIDRVNSLSSQSGRPLVDTVTETWNSSISYGFGVFNVWLKLGKDWYGIVANKGDRSFYDVSITLTEL